jgi:hypothetical protein
MTPMRNKNRVSHGTSRPNGKPARKSLAALAAPAWVIRTMALANEPGFQIAPGILIWITLFHLLVFDLIRYTVVPPPTTKS